jgi:dihydrofolate reductase
MSKVVVHGFGISLDGFAAGPDQSLEQPLGVNGFDVMQWFVHTRTWRSINEQTGGEEGIDNDIAQRGFVQMGAWILGRNMFGPVRGPWPDESWRGWWGEEPSYHVPTFVLTHYERAPLVMKGGTTFYFVTDGIHSALEQAKAAAGDRNVRIGGGASTIRQFLSERLIDEMHLAVSPVFLGRGEKVFDGIDMRALGYEVAETVAGERAAHMFIHKRAG